MAPRRSARNATSAADKPKGGVEKKTAKAAKPATKPAAEAAAAEKPAAKAVTKKGALAVGDYLPDFEVESDTSTEDKKVLQSSKDIAKDNGAVIFFYPKANTGGCTKQALGFNENAPKLEKAGYKVFGMSADKPKSQANWKAKYNLTYTLLSDPTYKVLKSLGVTKGDNKIARSHIVIGKGGVVEDIQIGVSPGDSVAKAAETILKGDGGEAEAVADEAVEEKATGDEEPKLQKKAKTTKAKK